MPENLDGSESYRSCIEFLQRPFEGDISVDSHRQQAARLMAEGEAVAVDNDAVWALWGNSGDNRFLEKISLVKQRQPNRALGLTMPHTELAPLIDLSRVHPSVRPLLENPEQLTSRLGAMAFIRVPGNQSAIKEREVPDQVITYDQSGGPILQNYDCSGKPKIESLLRCTARHGIRYPAVSSLNPSGKPEIVKPEDAISFARQHTLPILADLQATRKGTGSYPIIEFNEDGITLVREGNIAVDILQSLLHEFKLKISQSLQRSMHHPYSGGDMEMVRALRGTELRNALIKELGWSDN